MKRIEALIALVLLVIANVIKICALATFCAAYAHALEIEELAHEMHEELKRCKDERHLPIE